jgi:membrane protein
VSPVKKRIRQELAQIPGALALARLTAETFRVCMRYRVTGLASEAGFFALLSLPPLVLGLFGGLGYVGKWLGPGTVAEVSKDIEVWAGRFLTDDNVTKVIVPTVDNVLGNGRADITVVGFLIAAWSGSRVLNVFIDTISIMYGQSGVRGIIRTRALSFSLYVVSVLVGIVLVPLVLIGPDWLHQILPHRVQFLTNLYWPVVVVLVVASITTLFHISTPRRSPWVRDVPGALLTLVIWLLSSFVLRQWLGASVGGASTSIYGPLAAPIVVLIWLYFLAIAILIGAALNAAVRRLWPVEERPSSRAKAVEWVGSEVSRRRGAKPERPLTPLPEGQQRRERRARLDSDPPDRLVSVRTRSE